MLSNKQYFRRFMGLGFVGVSTFISCEVVKNYVEDRQMRFKSEY